jgi:hypothetical protein
MGTLRRLVAAFRAVPLLLRAGMFCGLGAGLAVGAMITPLAIGLLGGALFGMFAGAVAGTVMDRDDRRGVHRTKQLDAIIGITKGSMGAPKGAIPSGDLRRDPGDALELQSWAREWLTPAPPPSSALR